MSLVESIEKMNVEADATTVANQVRRPGRTSMFKPAQLDCGDAVRDCVLLDLSPHGAQVHLMAPAAVPELVTLRLSGTTPVSMRRCWNRGLHFGFEVVGTTPIAL